MVPGACVVSIELYEDKKWRKAHLSKMVYNDDELLLGRAFRILVNGEEVHREARGGIP